MSSASGAPSSGNSNHVGERVAKRFDGIVYQGTITEFVPEESNEPGVTERALWHICFDDGDEEDFYKEEVSSNVLLLGSWIGLTFC